MHCGLIKCQWLYTRKENCEHLKRDMSPDGFEHWKIVCPERDFTLGQIIYFGEPVGFCWRKNNPKPCSYYPATIPKDDRGLMLFGTAEWNNYREVSLILLGYNEPEKLKAQRTFKSTSSGIIPTNLLSLKSKMRFRFDFSQFEAKNYRALILKEGTFSGEEIEIQKHAPSSGQKFEAMLRIKPPPSPASLGCRIAI